MAGGNFGRVLRALDRRGVVRVSSECLEVDDVLSARDPVLAQLAAAAVAGLSPAGPAERKRAPVLFPAGGEPEIVGDLVVQDSGFNLHAKTHTGALDDEARARLLRYVLRPPPSHERLAVLPDHRVRLTLKRPWSDGTYALEMDALALLARLASAVPPPRQHQTRYAGALSAAAHWRPRLKWEPEGSQTLPRSCAAGIASRLRTRAFRLSLPNRLQVKRQLHHPRAPPLNLPISNPASRALQDIDVTTLDGPSSCA